MSGGGLVTPLWRARVRRACVPAGLWPAGLCPTLLLSRGRERRGGEGREKGQGKREEKRVRGLPPRYLTSGYEPEIYAISEAWQSNFGSKKVKYGVRHWHACAGCEVNRSMPRVSTSTQRRLYMHVQRAEI